jgi:hypothetical protein
MKSSKKNTKKVKEEKLSQKTIQEIEEARERIKIGKFYTEEEVKKLLNL